jgi:hypothetical protein
VVLQRRRRLRGHGLAVSREARQDAEETSGRGRKKVVMRS